MEPIIYTDEKTPDIEGVYGRAWKQDFESFKRRNPGLPADSSVCGWIVSAPWAYPLRSCYMIACVSLKDSPGLQPAKVMLPGATHEVFVVALDPEQKRIPLNDSPKMLRPVNFAGQWVAASDDDARLKIEGCVKEIVIHATLSPDIDFIRQWVDRFSGSNLKKGCGAL